MNFGNLSGWINGCEQVVFDTEITGSAVSSISTGNILNGDEDGWYTVIVRSISTNPGGDENVYLQFNADTGANYGIKGFYVENTSSGSAAATGQTGIPCGYAASANYSSFYVGRLYAKSGSVRLMNGFLVKEISGTTVTTLRIEGAVWSNTADNITAIQLVSGAANGIGVGTRLIILKSNNFTNGTPTGVITTPYIQGSWVRVGSSVLGSAASSVTFSGLDGDRDVIYMMSMAMKNGSASTGSPYLRLNDSSTASTYGYQYMDANSTTIGAGRGVAGVPSWLPHLNGLAAGNYSQSNMIMFAKSGFLRPAIFTASGSISGTTVTFIEASGQSWSNTADNITSIVIRLYNALNFDTGSQFALYALRPNG